MKTTQQEIHDLVIQQKEFFLSDKTLDISFRKTQLIKLKEAVICYKERLCKALSQDLGRCENEGYLTDIGPLIMEINEALSQLNRWAKPETHFSGLLCFPSLFTKVYKMPYGNCLIISPFNFPVLLTLGVLVPAIAGGNTAVLKLSSKSSHCTEVLIDLIQNTFDREYICAIGEGHDVADMLLDEAFDKIFYTGSPAVAKHVLEKAAKNLTPVALELGGENGNWAIVRKDADLKDAARKIAFFKTLNSGQICININQVAVSEKIADKFIRCLKEEFVRQVTENPLTYDEYPHLITSNAFFKAVKDLTNYKDRIIFGGKTDENTLRVEPTILYPIDINEEIVQKELFSPLLPICVFKDDEIEDLLDILSRREHALALYLFTRDISWAKKTMQKMQYGGGCVNEVCLHLMVKNVPFNGTGHSGMGSYHGEWGFREFTHPSTVLYGCTRFNLSLREHPLKSSLKRKLLELFER